MTVEHRPSQQLESSLSARELFELGSEIAGNGKTNRFKTGLTKDNIFVGTFQGNRYQIRHTVSSQDYQRVTVIGRDLGILVEHGALIGDEYKGSVEYKETDNDVSDILINLQPETETEPVSKGEVKSVRVFTLLEYDRGGYYPSSFEVAAENEQEALRKYLDWCEATGNFHAMHLIKTGVTRFEETKRKLLA